MRDRFGIFGAVIRIRKLSLLLVMTLRMPNKRQLQQFGSTMLVEKLSLPTRKHPHPYHIQWLNDGGKIRITPSVRVPFSMGAYSNFVDCDVIPMEACSLLLERP